MSVELREGRQEHETEEPSLTDAAAAVFAAARDRLQHIVELAAAELRLAAMSGVAMLVMAILAAALLIVAWGLLTGVAAYLLVAAGLSWPWAGTALALIHLLAAFFLLRGAVKLSQRLTLPRLRRTLVASEE